MTTKQLALYALFFILGIVVGGVVVNLAYKPLFVAQAIEIYRWEEDNKRLDDNYAVSKVKIEALRQDMNEFMDRPTLLKSLGIEVEESSYSNLSNN